MTAGWFLVDELLCCANACFEFLFAEACTLQQTSNERNISHQKRGKKKHHFERCQLVGDMDGYGTVPRSVTCIQMCRALLKWYSAYVSCLTDGVKSVDLLHVFCWKRNNRQIQHTVY